MSKAKLSKTRTVPYRRKREGKTDYHKRLQLLLSDKPRIVVRKTNTKLIVQLVRYVPAGDVVICSATPKDLQQAGWTFNCKNTPAAYLLGLALGKKALQQKVSEAIVDLGLHAAIKGSKLYAVVKGCIDAGLQIPHDPAVFPSEDRIQGKAIAGYVKQAGQITTIFEHVKKKLQG